MRVPSHSLYNPGHVGWPPEPSDHGDGHAVCGRLRLAGRDTCTNAGGGRTGRPRSANGDGYAHCHTPTHSHVNSRAHGDGRRVASTQPGSDYIASCYSSRCRHGICADVHTDHASDAQSISHTDSNVDV